MNRREFLKELSSPSQIPSEAPEAPLPFERVPSAGSPRQYRTGARVLVEDVRAWLCRDDGGFYAIDAHCPHLGCLVHPVEYGFVCPCHRSAFNAAGEYKHGPAPRSLRYLYIDLDAAGHLVIYRDRSVDPRDRLIA